MVIRDGPRSPRVAHAPEQEMLLTNWLTLLERRAAEPGRGKNTRPAGKETVDAVQDVLIWAWDHLDDLLRKGEAEVAAMLRQLMRDAAAKRARGVKRRERRLQRHGELRAAGPQEASPSDADVLKAECERVLAEALDGLPPPYHDVVVWHFLEKRTWEDIGQHLGCTERHARRLGEQGLAILRGTLAGRV
jgi:RNA polymerase sigma factor (sigma-70 family)